MIRDAVMGWYYDRVLECKYLQAVTRMRLIENERERERNEIPYP